MHPRSFEYKSPESLEAALEVLSQYGEDAKVIAGGQSLVPLMKLRLATPACLVDLNRIPDLSYIREEKGQIRFGALTRHAQVESSEVVRSRLPALRDTVGVIGDVQIRNLGTMGGSLVHADPAADLPATLLALGATVHTLSPRGKRALKVEDLILDAYTTDLSADEILTEVTVPLPEGVAGGAYRKFERRAGDFAVAGVAVQMRLGKDERCEEIAISMSALGFMALRAAKAESLLRGQPITEERIEEAAGRISGECEPLVDNRGSVEYKRHLAGVVFKQAFRTALDRAKAGKG